MKKVRATIEEYDYRMDKTFIFDVEGEIDEDNGTILYSKDGIWDTIRYEQDLNREGCRVSLKSYEVIG